MIPSEIEEQAKKQNFYVSHLAEVNKTQEVTSSEDVFNDKGVLLVKKGIRINQDVADRILNHKLLKPLEEQVALESSLDKTVLISDFNQLFLDFSDLKKIHDVHEFEEDLKKIIQVVSKKKFLLQKLTVLKHQLSDVYTKALFSAWLSGLLAKKLDLEESDIQCAFIAGLFHDIGLLHISPEILFKKGKLEPHEWRAIQSHVVIGFMLFSNMTKKFTKVALAILEHHESCDGTGYPSGKYEDSLGIIGQIVAMADSLQAVRLNQFTKTGMNLHDALPFLNMNTSKHFSRVYQSTCLVIMEAELPVTEEIPYDNIDEMIETLIERVGVLQDAIVVLMLICDLTKSLHDNEKSKKFTSVVLPVVHMINSSGLGKEDILMWLKTLKLKDEQNNIRELIEMDLMQQELLWQLKKSVRFIDEFLDGAKLLSERQLAHMKKLSTYLFGSLKEKSIH